MTRLNVAVVPVTPFEQNCTLIWVGEGGEGVVIDPGGDVPRIREAIARSGMVLKEIWLTHGHIDHVGGASELSESAGVPVIGPHEADRALCAGIERQAAMFGLPSGFRNVTPTRWLADGDVLSVGDARFDVLHCPGHSPGHVVFVEKTARFAHLGDVLFAGSIGRTDLPGGNHATLLASIRDKVLPLGDDVTFLCGHGPGSRIGDERRGNPFLVDL